MLHLFYWFFLFFPSSYPDILALEIYSGAYSVMGWHNLPLGLPTCMIPSCFITFLYTKFYSIHKSHGFSGYSPQKHACNRNKSRSHNSDSTISSSFLRNFRVERTRSLSSGGNFIHSSIYRHFCMGRDQGLPWVVVCSSPHLPSGQYNFITLFLAFHMLGQDNLDSARCFYCLKCHTKAWHDVLIWGTFM